MMNIVFLDGYTVNPGDISWQALQALGTFTVYDRTPASEVLSRAAGAEILIVNKTRLTRALIEQLPALRLVCVAAAGVDGVDAQAATERGIRVCNAAGYGTESVAQHVFALLLELTNRVGEYAAANRQGYWSRSQDFCCRHHPLTELCGKRMAIVGLGRIGLAVARIAYAFGLRVSVVTHRPADDLPPFASRLSLEEAFAQCDIVSLNCPLTQQNVHMVNRDLLSQAKPGLLLVNTARGALIDEAALVEALQPGGVLSGYAADVMEHEPPRADHPLLHLDNAYITPHMAWLTNEARGRIMNIVAENIRTFLATGTPANAVN